MNKFLAGFMTGIVVATLAGLVIFTVPKIADKIGVPTGKREVVEKFECSRVVKVTTYEKSLFSFPPPILFPRYEHHLTLENGRKEVVDSMFFIDVGRERCRLWTEYIN